MNIIFQAYICIYICTKEATFMITELTGNTKGLSCNFNSNFENTVPGKTRLSPICKWKNIFIRVNHLCGNWSKGRCTITPGLRGHTDKLTAMDSNGKLLVITKQM